MAAHSTDPRTDQQLVDAANGGDAEAFEALYERYRDWVVSLAWRLTGDRETALDVMQETFAYVLQLFPGFELRARFTTFLYPLVRHRATAARRARRPAESDAALAQVAAKAGSEKLAALREILDSLPLGQREVLILRFADGLSLAEIAIALEVPVGTVKSRLHNTLRGLREDPRIKNIPDD